MALRLEAVNKNTPNSAATAPRKASAGTCPYQGHAPNTAVQDNLLSTQNKMPPIHPQNATQRACSICPLLIGAWESAELVSGSFAVDVELIQCLQVRKTTGLCYGQPPRASNFCSSLKLLKQSQLLHLPFHYSGSGFWIFLQYFDHDFTNCELFMRCV
jgi:hypothetical protein